MGLATIGLLLAATLVFLTLEKGKNTPTPNTNKGVTYTRSYPSVIKGTFNPGKDLFDSFLNTHLEKAKEVGFNTVYVYVLHQYDSGVLKPVSPKGAGSFSPKAEEEHIEMIKLAKEKGMAVHLALEFGGGTNPALGVPQTQFLEDTKKAASHWAEIGESYLVEFFAPASEIDFHIHKEYFGSDFNKRSQVVTIVNQFHQDILPSLRQVFKGKLLYQHASYDQPGVLATGYDYIGIDFGPAGRSLKEFRSYVRNNYTTTAQTAQNSGCSWLVTEFGVDYKKPEPGNPNPTQDLLDSSGQAYNSQQDEFYQVAVDEYLAFKGNKKPQGFGIFSYLHPRSSTKDREAEKVLKDFFSKI